MKLKKNKRLIFPLLGIILILLLGIIGGYYLFRQNLQKDRKSTVQTRQNLQKDRKSTVQTETSSVSNQKSSDAKEVFSCLSLGGNQQLVKEQPYKSGMLVFKAKEGISEESILKEIKKLGYDLKTVNSPWGYSGVDRSSLFIKHLLTPDEAKGLIKPIVDKYELQEKNTGFYYSTARIIFKRLLDANEQEGINKQLSNLEFQGKVTEFSWNFAPKQLYGFLAVPSGREEDYIEKLYKLGIFDCVSKELNTIPSNSNTIPYMPGVHQ